MSQAFQDIVVLIVMSVLVKLFAWLYLRERRRELALWLWGWIFISLHFALPVVDSFVHAPLRLRVWVHVVTLIIAGTAFFLSVSEVFRKLRERLIFLIFIAGAAVVYLTAYVLGVRSVWFYVAVLAASTVSG